jgi:hypothetical protein
MRSILYCAGCAVAVVVAVLLLAGDRVLFERLAFAGLIVGQFLAVVFAAAPTGVGSSAGKLTRQRRPLPVETGRASLSASAGRPAVMS